MVAAIHVAGPAEIQTDCSNGEGTMAILGFTANGADLTKEASWLNVPGDENGGDDGPPIDIQFLGEIARIRLELTKYDIAQTVYLESRLKEGTGGTPGTAGTLMFTDGKTVRLLINSTTVPINFPRALPRGLIEVNRGTKFSRMVLEFEAHKDGGGTLYDNDVTGAA